MRYDSVKYERGQIWVIRFKRNESVGREQMKDRPWVILSIGKFNSSSGLLTCAPITTRDRVVTPAQVLFTNHEGRSNVILCEQIRTFDYRSGEYILDYMGTLSDEVLEKVDVALSIHLGMHYSPITLKSLYDNMEAIVKSVGYMQEKERSKVFTEEDVKDFAAKLGSLVSSTPVSTIVPTPILPPLSTSEVLSTDECGTSSSVEDSIVEVEPDTTPGDEEIPPPKSKRISWTPDNCRKFLKDCDELPMKVVMERWHILKKTRFYSTKNYVRSLLMQKTDT